MHPTRDCGRFSTAHKTDLDRQLPIKDGLRTMTLAGPTFLTFLFAFLVYAGFVPLAKACKFVGCDVGQVLRVMLRGDSFRDEMRVITFPKIRHSKVMPSCGMRSKV